MKALQILSKKFALLLLCLLIPFAGLWAQKTIVIGSSAKADHPFAAFDSLLTEVSSGNITGQITFAFESGSYALSKAIVVNSAKFTAKDHLTITSVAKDRDSVVFSYNGSIAALQLNNTKNVTFSHITISSTKTSACHAVGVNGPVENVLFYKCTIAVPLTATSGNCCPIGTASATAATDKGSISAAVNGLAFVGNIITGGCRGIWLNGSSTNHLNNIRIDSNEILNSYDVDANITYCDTVSFANNIDIPRPGINANHYGITLSSCVVEKFCGNLINYAGVTQSAHTGVLLTITNCTPASGKRFLVANNVVIGKTILGYKTSIGHLATMNNLQADILHNSIFNNKATTNATYSVNCLNIAGASTDVNVIGNMLVTIDTNQFPLRIDTSTASCFTDYNNYWSNGGFLARDNVKTFSSLSAVQGFTGGDKYSLSINPTFADASQGLKLENPGPFTIVPNPGVTEDFQGMTRDKTTTIGAYGVASLDAALADFGKTEFVATASGNIDLYLTVMNAGMTTLTSATLFWDDGSTVQKYGWTGKLAIGEKDSVKVGTFKATLSTYAHIKAWVTDPNSGKDGFADNDTIETTRYICKEVLAGDYTVGKGMDFATLDDALFILENCGVKAPIRLLLAGGTYGSTTIDVTAPGSDNNNTVTLMPYKNDTVIFDGGSTSSSLIVDGISHWVFQGLTIGNTKDGVGGVELKGGNKDVTFRNCDIYSNQTTKKKVANSTTCESGVKMISANNATVYPVDVRFIGNRIVGGTVNFLLVYAGGTQAQMPNASILIDSNTMEDAYYAALYNSSYSVVKSFCYNTVKSRANSDTMFTAIHGNTSGLWGNIIGNRIHITTKITNTSGSSTAAYGMVFLNGANTTATAPAYIFNNEIFIKDSSTATKSKYGMYIGTAANWEVHYNTIYIYANSGTCYGMYLSNSNNSFKINATRNLVFCDNAGTRYPLYMTTANAVVARGLRAYNNFYSATNVAYISAAKTTVAALQSATGQDTATISIKPVFSGTNLIPDNDTDFNCPVDASLILTDINGQPRKKTTTMGAYHCAKSSGNYIVIGSSVMADHPFSAFDSLLNEVSAGNMTGQITFAFESGTYVFTKALNVNTAKFTAKDHLTITSVAQNRDSVTFRYSTGTIIPGFILLNNTNHVTFSHLYIHNNSTSNGHTVCMNGPIEDVTFYHCYLKRTSGTNFATAGTMQTIGATTLNNTGAQDNNNGNNGPATTIKWVRYIGNTIENGCRNIITIATTNRIQGLVFNDNTIFDNTAAGILIYRADSVTCNRNHVMVKDKTTSYWTNGIQLTAITGDSVCGNTVSFLNQNNTYYGGAAINVSGVVNTKTGIGKSGRILIANNVILGYNSSSYVSNNKGSCSLLALSKVQADVWFNSIYNSRTSYAPTAGLNNKTVYMIGIGDTSDVHLVGNQLIALDNKNQYIMNVAPGTANAGKVVSEYNNFYFMNGGTAYACHNDTAVNSLSTLLGLINDKGSVSMDPKFSNPDKDLKLGNPGPFTIVPNPGLAEDIQGLSRGKTTTIGAYAVASLDAALTDFGKTDFNAASGGSNDLYLTIMNAGMTTLTSATLFWDDGSTVQKYAWSGKLALGDKDSVKVGTFKAVAGTMCHLKAWVADPNSGKDEFAGNDTIEIEKYICKGALAGDYTVGKGMDFADLDEAIQVMHSCGIAKPVRLLVVGGTYGTTTISDSIPGSSYTNTITLMPYKNDNVVIDGGTGTSLQLNGAKHWIFNGITIGNTTNGLIGVNLTGAIRDVTFRGCNIYSQNTTTSSSYRAVNLPNTSSSTTYPVDLNFIGNRIEGGYYNFYLYYTAGGTYTDMKKASVHIDSNILANAYYYGVYSYYRSAVKSFCYNTITNRSNCTNAYHGIYGTQYGMWDKIVGNRFRLNSTTTNYGINMATYQQYGQYCDSIPAYIYNNEVVITGGGTKYGIYISSPSGNWEVHHNTVYIKSAGTAYGLYFANSVDGYLINATRNLVFCDSTGTRYPLYMTTANAVATRGVRAYNNLYSATNVAYIGAAKTTVAALQSATNQDANTISVMPVYNDITKDLVPANDTAFRCPANASITLTDINGNARARTTLMGAYHSANSGNTPTNDAELVGFYKEKNIYAGKFPVYVIVRNNGTDDIKQANISCTINGISQTALFYQPTKPLGSMKSDTVELGQYNFALGSCTLTAWIDLTGDASHSNDTITTKLNVIAKEDVALLDFANTYLDGGQQSKIYVTMFNNGLDTLKSVEIHWKSANVVQTTYYWKGALAAGDSTVVCIGNTTPAARRFIALVAWTENPNSLIDGNLHNDTIETKLFSCNGPLSGTLTVASSGGARTLFNTIEEAVQALNTCGVNGAVILSIGMPLTLNQLILSDSVPGSSSVNTISLTPDAGLTVTINYGSYGPSLILDNTKHWIFSNFSIGDSVRGLTGIQMKGTNRDIAFYNCDIHASRTATGKESNAVEFINNSKKDYPTNVRFSQCNISGGFANFYLTQTAGAPDQMDKASIHINNSNLYDGFAYGIFSQEFGAIKTLSHNIITNRSDSKDYTAVFSESYAVWNEVDGNRIQIKTGGDAYGFYLNKNNQDMAYTQKSALLTNNEIRIDGSGKTQCGILLNNPEGNWEIHHNSIRVMGSKSTTNYGMNLLNPNSKCKVNVTRNIVIADGSTSYPLYFSSAKCVDANYGNREWNAFYSVANVANIEGKTFTSVAQLQSATGQDANSVQTQPAFIDVTKDLQLKDYMPYRCPAILTMVGKDINNKARIKLTPMGCYTIDMYELANLKFKEVISPKVVDDAVCYSSSVPVTVELENSGMKSVSYDTANLKISVDISGAATLHFDTTFQKGGLKGNSSEKITLGSFQTTTDGVYNVKLTIQCKADDTTSDNEANITYQVYRIGLPYDVDFSSAPKEMVTRTVSGDAQWTLFGSGNPAPVYGKGILMLGSSSNKGSVAHATFNGIHLDGYTQPKLTFWYAHTNGKNQGDSLIVKASTDGGATFTVLCRLAAAGSTAGWKEYSYDLSKFATDPCLSIVFEGITGGIAQQIDRIRISALQDAAISLLPIDLGNLASCDKNPLDIKAVVTNRTMQPITFTNDTIRMQVTGAINASTQYVYSNTLAGMAADTITVGQFVPYAEGNYYLNIFMQSQDDVAANDTLRDSTLYFHRDLQLVGCTGIDSVTAHTADELLPLTATIANRGSMLVDRYLVQVKVNGDTYTDTVYQTLYAGDTTTHIISFQVPFATKENPYYSISVSVHMDCDADYTNDTIHMVGLVNVPDTVDIQVLDIITTSPAEGNTLLKPSVRIANMGNTAAGQFKLHVLLIDNSYQAIDTLTEIISGLAIQENRLVAFTQSYSVPNYTGKYMLRAYVDKLADDPIQSNDTLLKSFECTEKVGIRNVEQLGWSLGQNIPNPATEMTAIPYTLPQSGLVRISVMTANGQIIHRQEIQGEAGANRLDLNTADWAAGIYYYTMEYCGQRITRKMNIAR